MLSAIMPIIMYRTKIVEPGVMMVVVVVIWYLVYTWCTLQSTAVQLACQLAVLLHLVLSTFKFRALP